MHQLNPDFASRRLRRRLKRVFGTHQPPRSQSRQPRVQNRAGEVVFELRQGRAPPTRPQSLHHALLGLRAQRRHRLLQSDDRLNLRTGQRRERQVYRIRKRAEQRALYLMDQFQQAPTKQGLVQHRLNRFQ
ncbi:hypothetical protein HRbin14_01981 [bacterium HR14]|nr:hypothetical protein HRbin14_01981 [bacterium HR14]